MTWICVDPEDFKGNIKREHRVAGNGVRQQMLRDLLNSGGRTWTWAPGASTPTTTLATLLKAFLGELPEPLLTHRQFHAHLKIAGKNTGIRDTRWRGRYISTCTM